MIQEKSYSSFKKAIWFLLAVISFFTAITIDRLDNKTQITPVVQQKISRQVTQVTNSKGCKKPSNENQFFLTYFPKQRTCLLEYESTPNILES